MKKLILLFVTLAAAVSINAQRVFIYDSIPMPAGSDTTIYRMFYSVDNWSLAFDYSALDTTLGVLDLAGVDVNDGSAFDRLDDDRLPFTLSDSTVAFEKDNFSFRYLAIKFTPNGCSSGTIYFYLIKR